MFCKMHFLFLAAFCTSFHLILCETGCRPSFIRSVSISQELILSWTPPLADDCEIGHYLITIWSRGVETHYKVEGLSLNVSFLPMCESARFNIKPVSIEDLEGQFRSVILRMPVHKDANVTIDNIRIIGNGGRFLHLQGELEEEWQNCTNQFRVTIYDENNDEARDIYVETNAALLQNVQPCEDYTIGVRAIHSVEREGPVSLIRYTIPSAVITPPTLQSIALGPTAVQLEWQLERITRNRCPLSSIVIESPSHFTVSYPIHDTSERLISTKVASLQQDTMYFLNVTVINSAGPSIPYYMAIQTLPDNLP